MLRTAGLSSRVCGSLLTRPVTLSDLTSPLRASLKCKTKIRKLQIVYISRSCDQEQPQVNSCEALRIAVGKKETKVHVNYSAAGQTVLEERRHNLSTKNFISAFVLIQD